MWKAKSTHDINHSNRVRTTSSHASLVHWGPSSCSRSYSEDHLLLQPLLLKTLWIFFDTKKYKKTCCFSHQVCAFGVVGFSKLLFKFESLTPFFFFYACLLENENQCLVYVTAQWTSKLFSQELKLEPEKIMLRKPVIISLIPHT